MDRRSVAGLPSYIALTGHYTKSLYKAMFEAEDKEKGLPQITNAVSTAKNLLDYFMMKNESLLNPGNTLRIS